MRTSYPPKSLGENRGDRPQQGFWKRTSGSPGRWAVGRLGIPQCCAELASRVGVSPSKYQPIHQPVLPRSLPHGAGTFTSGTCSLFQVSCTCCHLPFSCEGGHSAPTLQTRPLGIKEATRPAPDRRNEIHIQFGLGPEAASLLFLLCLR